MTRPNRATLLSAILFAAPAFAGSANWNGGSTSNSNWSTSTNWSAAVAVDDPGAIYTFQGANRLSPNIDQNWKTSRLAFTATGFTITASANVGLTLYGSNDARVLNVATGTLLATVNVPITFAVATSGSGYATTNSRAIDVSGATTPARSTLVVNGSINTNGGSVLKTGTGFLTLNAANTFASGTMFGWNTADSVVRLGSTDSLGNATIVHSGNATTSGFTVAGSSSSALGTANVRLVNANVNLASSTYDAELVINNTLTLSDSGVFGITEDSTAVNNNSVINFAGQATVTGSKQIGVFANSVGTISGQIVDGTAAGQVNKTNTGTLILSNANNTFGGGVLLSNGALRAGSDKAFGTGTVNLTSTVSTSVSAVGARTFANAVTLGGVNTVTFGQAGFTNGDMTFDGAVSLNGLNTNATAGDADDLKSLSVSSGVTTTFNGNITEVNASSGIAKFGPGTLALAGTNTFTGGVTVNAGTVHVTGSNTSNVTVPAGKVSGTGTVRVLSLYDGTADATANGGTLSPGTDTAADTFKAGRADFADGGNYLFNLTSAAGAAGTGWDLLNLTGVGTANGNLNVTAIAGGFTLKLGSLDPAFDPSQDQVFRFVQALGVLNFAAGDILVDTSGLFAGGGAFTVAQDGNNLNLVYSAAPEPAAWLTASLGAAIVTLTRRRRAAVGC